MNTGAERADNFFEHQKWSKFFFSPNTWQTVTFLNPLDALIPKIPFSFFFLPILGLGHLRGLGVSLRRILGVPPIEPFLGEGGV